MSNDAVVQEALREGVNALRLLAEYRMPPTLGRRLHDLGENKEFLSPEQHQELVELAEFAEDRTLEKLKATAALARLRQAVPSLFENP